MMNFSTVLSAFLAAIATGGSALTAVWLERGAAQFSDISPVGYAIIGVGMVISIAKDIRSSIREPK